MVRRRRRSITARMAGWRNHNADIWGQTGPVGNYGGGDPVWANWAMGGAWLSLDFWEHYSFGGDKKFLRERGWPVLKGAAEFCLDWLIEDGQGHLVTAPSGSPELGFTTPEGKRATVSMASTMDMSIIWGIVHGLHRSDARAGHGPEFCGEAGGGPRKTVSAQNWIARAVAGMV